MNRDEVISEFIAITQSSSRDAREYLETANWSVPAAVDFYFDSVTGEAAQPTVVPQSKPPEPKIESNISGNDQSKRTDTHSSNDAPLRSITDNILRLKLPSKTPVAVPIKPNYNRSIISSNINTFDSVRRNQDDSDDDDDNQGQAFYVGGSERSGQQIIEPPKRQDNDKKVTEVFEAARKQGATQAQDEKSTLSSRREEKPFTDAGRSLVGNNRPPRGRSQPPSGAAAAAAAAAAAPLNAVEQLPIRFYSNGFTVGDGELRTFEDNAEFMEHIKRGEVPPELRQMNTNGRRVEVSLEDHRGEEYKRVAPAFKPFSGTGQTIGLSGSNSNQRRSSVALSGGTASESSDSSPLEKLAATRLNTSSSSTMIRLRLPDMSTPISIKIDTNRTLGDIRRFITENVPSLQMNTFEFLEPPATKIKRDDERRKISDSRLANSTLVIRRTT